MLPSTRGNKRDTANAEREWASQLAAYVATRQKIQAAAEEQANSEAESYQKSRASIQTQLDDFMRQAAQNIPPAVTAIQKLGISWAEFQNMNADQRLDTILNALGKMPDSLDKAAIEMKLFGRAGSDINEVAEIYYGLSVATDQANASNHAYTNNAIRDQERLAEKMAQAKASGFGITQEDVDHAKDFKIAWNELDATIKSFGIDLGKELVVPMTTLIKMLTEFLQAHKEEIISFLKQLATDVLPKAIELTGQLLALLERLDGKQGAGGQSSALGDILNNPATRAALPSGVSWAGFLLQILGAAQGRASGGNVSAGGVYPVEEGGIPEVFIPSSGGQVQPLPKAAAMGALGGNTYYYFTINHPQQNESSVLDDIRRAQRLMR